MSETSALAKALMEWDHRDSGETVRYGTLADWETVAAEAEAVLGRRYAALLLDRAESYQRDAGVIRQSGRHAEAVAYETIAAELRRVAEEWASEQG